jgi:hypothetical protein
VDLLVESPRPELYSEAAQKFSWPLAGLRDDREAKITLGSASFAGRIKNTDRERRAAARAEGKTAGTEKSKSRSGGSFAKNC